MAARLGEIKRRARRLRDAERAQRAAIAEARSEGHSLREIAAAAGLTPEGIRKILQRGEK